MGIILKQKKGFTLVEIMVSVSVFAIVMLISSSSIFGVFDSNRKSQSLRSVMDNLNLSLEAMTRTIRFGKNYHCDAQSGVITSPRDCSGGANSISVLDSNSVQVTYLLCTSGANTGRIARSTDCVNGPFITSSDVTITQLTYYVLGSTPYSSGSDVFQPRVIVVVSGYSGVKTSSRSTFNLQTTISQRQFDSQ